MLVHYNQTSDILYYEVLDIPLPELQGLKTLKVAFHHATKDEVVIHTIRLPKQSSVGDVINDLKTKVELSHPNAELRLLEVFYHKIYKIFPLNEKIENINDQYWTLRAEEAGDALIQLYHNFITDFETKINLLKLAHFAVIVSRQYLEKEAAFSYLEGVIEKLRATREMCIEEPILYIKMQITIFNLEKGTQKRVQETSRRREEYA